MAKTFQIYRSSAGSGKTRTLAKEYLKLAFKFRSDYFKHILAVTFTNKSTQEMKDRIMQYLNDFANGKNEDLALELQSELNLSATEFKERSLEVQSSILHDYGNFSISTIDAFFQRVIRSFTYEAGISGDYRLEVDRDPVMEEVISNLVDELGNNPDLTKWVVELALQKLEDDKPWDMRQGLMEFSNELFRDEFKLIEEQVASISSMDFLTQTKKLLQNKRYEFVNALKAKAKKVLDDIHTHHFSVEDFSNKGSGIYGFFRKMNDGEVFGEIGSRVQSCLTSSDSWVTKTHYKRKDIMKLAEEKWIASLGDLVDFRNAHIKAALSAEEALKNFYSFGLITDISRKLIEFKKENNLMLLSDAPQFLNKIISDSDTPFIYEKAGSFFRNFLIDEFQDTSAMQWKNFLPLVANNLDSGYPSLVVGDVKQSIYRWRGGDKNLLQHNIYSEIGTNRIETKLLNHNYRSATSVVSFNNELFKSAALSVSMETAAPVSTEEYKDVEQDSTKKQTGFVHACFFEDRNWKDQALELAAKYIEDLQQLGAKPGEIAILVRKKEEGKQIISHLLDRKSSAAVAGVVYDVVSSESLLIAGASVVNFLIAALRYLHNPDDDIARAQLAYEHARVNTPDSIWSDVFAVTNQSVFESGLPPAFATRKIQLRKLPLFELVETLIGIFDLENTAELPYLLGFQDAVMEFVTRERNDLGAFLDWWEDQKGEKSIVAPSGSSAMQLMTIHKAKGLQFKYVLIPFCYWAMDHEHFKQPNLWVSSDQTFFKDIGYIPVRYSSKLEETFFSEAYTREHADIYLDNLNLLYVAFTRAEYGLAFFGPAGARNSSSQLVLDSILKSPILKENWNANQREWKSGDLTTAPSKSAITENTSSTLKQYPVSEWREKLVIKKSAWGELKIDDEQRKKILSGIYIHAALSTVTYAEDIPVALQKLADEGSVTFEEKENLEHILNSWMQNPVIADWFSPKWKVQTEATVLLQGGESIRIDRLLTDGKTARVIDFKTGSPTKKDQTQVAEYCELLKQMGFEAEGYLLYLADGDVIPIGKTKPSKKKPSSQLGLDF